MRTMAHEHADASTNVATMAGLAPQHASNRWHWLQSAERRWTSDVTSEPSVLEAPIRPARYLQ